MKHDDLRSIGHNLAASLASGFLVGGYEGTDVFGEVARSTAGFIEIDFLNGTISRGEVSPDLARTVAKCPDALSRLCARHHVSLNAFVELAARYHARDRVRGYTVIVADRAGRRTSTEYGYPQDQRLKMLDHEGRIRRIPVQTLTSRAPKA